MNSKQRRAFEQYANQIQATQRARDEAPAKKAPIIATKPMEHTEQECFEMLKAEGMRKQLEAIATQPVMAVTIG